ncbi:MAG: S-adenosylmethionine:tRNA ribosyltransferase-isomerase [Bacteroidales bacterium]|nr:S-adenosylmethionine:tRNA ribosyltransferase-isomerase [Bacteroidales bacterium]
MFQKEIRIEDYDYELSAERIAFYPEEARAHSRMLVYDSDEHKITDSSFEHLADFFTPDMMLVFNDSRVIHARLLVHNATGAAIEIFCLEPVKPTAELTLALAQQGKVTWKCFVGNAKRWKQPLSFEVIVNGRCVRITAEKKEPVENAFLVDFQWDDESVSFAEWVEAYGKMPLPPYIKRTAEKEDEERYQTVYARFDGSVAAPTAGLHFTRELIQELEAHRVVMDYITLHVGAGTFKPVTAEKIGEHFMHDEQIVIRRDFVERLLQHADKKIVSVGTTVTRSLESVFIIGAKLHLGLPDPLHVTQWEVYENSSLAETDTATALQAVLDFLRSHDLDAVTASTQLMIVPSYRFKLMKGIITNFHQPKSTLLLLIAAFLGESWRDIYRHALDHGYRFLSYGDANFYLPRKS